MIKGVVIGLLVAAPACAAGGTLLAKDPGTLVPADRPVVMVSGRNTGGSSASEVVRLASEPDGPISGMVADATLADVVRSAGGWLEVETLTGPSVRGWIADGHLRETVHLRPPAKACEVTLLDAPAGREKRMVALDTPAEVRAVHVTGGQTWVKVASAEGTGWVAQDQIQELPAEAGECL